MKIAVCIHGESRTWEKCAPSIRHFFEGDKSFDVTYFGHSWTRNSWKKYTADVFNEYVYEDLDGDTLHNAMISKIPFAKLKIDIPLSIDIEDIPRQVIKEETSSFETLVNRAMPWQWNSISYSAMLSNFLKQQYEIENDMRFKLVVQVRFDECFNPECTFGRYLRPGIRENVIYTEVSHRNKEFMMQSVNDAFYYGTSRTMDLIESFYRVYHNGTFFNLVDANYFDGAYKSVGYGALIYKWATMKNIYPEHLGPVYCAVLRENTKVKDVMTEYNEIVRESFRWGTLVE